MAAPHTLASYVSQLIQRRVALGSFSDEPRLVTEKAALLLGDIKGSTGIVERVGSQGALALETLTSNLSQLYSDFIEEVCAFGGDVLFIAGDAFLCYWPAGSGNLAAVTAQAVRAGVSIQHRLVDRDDGFGDELIFRIGVGAGRLNRAFVGGQADRWELVLSGSAFDQVAAAEKAATPGCVLHVPRGGGGATRQRTADSRPTRGGGAESFYRRDRLRAYTRRPSPRPDHHAPAHNRAPHRRIRRGR